VLCAPSAVLTINIGVLKFRDLAKLWFFELIVTKSNFKKIVMISSPLRHRKTSPK